MLDYISYRDVDKAIRLLSQTISIEPDNDKNYYKRYRLDNLMQPLYDVGQTDDAIDSW